MIPPIGSLWIDDTDRIVSVVGYRGRDRVAAVCLSSGEVVVIEAWQGPRASVSVTPDGAILRAGRTAVYWVRGNGNENATLATPSDVAYPCYCSLASGEYPNAAIWGLRLGPHEQAVRREVDALLDAGVAVTLGVKRGSGVP
mgnify:FL=1